MNRARVVRGHEYNQVSVERNQFRLFSFTCHSTYSSPWHLEHHSRQGGTGTSPTQEIGITEKTDTVDLGLDHRGVTGRETGTSPTAGTRANTVIPVAVAMQETDMMDGIEGKVAQGTLGVAIEGEIGTIEVDTDRTDMEAEVGDQTIEIDLTGIAESEMRTIMTVRSTGAQ